MKRWDRSDKIKLLPDGFTEAERSFLDLLARLIAEDCLEQMTAQETGSVSRKSVPLADVERTDA